MADADAERQWNEFRVNYPSIHAHLYEMADIVRNHEQISTSLVDQVGQNTRQINELQRQVQQNFHTSERKLSKLNKEQLNKAQKQKTHTVLNKKMVELSNKNVPEVLKNPHIMKTIQNFAKAGKRRPKTKRRRRMRKTKRKHSKTNRKRSNK